MRADERYELLILLHTFVTERGTAALHAVDIARDLADSITPAEFGSDRVWKADILRAQVVALLP